MQAYDIDIDDGETRRRMRTALSARAERLAARGERLLDEGWDINTLILLADDADWLAGLGRHLAATELAAPLAAIDALLQPFLDPPRLPDATARADLAALVTTVEAACADARADDPVMLASHALVERTRAEENGFPLLASPPPDYWRRHAIEPQEPPAPLVAPAPLSNPSEARAADARSGAGQPTTPPASVEDSLPAGAEPALCYYLGPAGDLALAIEQHLALRGIGFSRFDRADGFKSQLARQPPGLVVVDAGFEAALDEIGALVKSARERVSHRVHLAAFSAGGDLNARLHAMRAGCDAFIALPASTPAVLARLDELAHAHTPDPYRILIIEDDRTQALFADSILRKGGMQTLTLTDALAVLDELDRFRPDLILMDLHMPGCDGMELTALIREREAFVSTPIVFLSGEQDADKHFDALSAGGDDFLSKPIRPKHLISAVLNRVRRARRQQRRTPAPAETRALSGPVEKRQLLDRLSGLLAMDDAGRREGGLLFFGVQYTAAPHERIGWSRRDRLIEAIGRHLGEAIGPGDLVTRCGDSGFAVLTRERDVAALEDWAGVQRTRLLAALEEPALGLTVGICPFNAGIGDAGAMLDAAEHAAVSTGLTGVASVQAASPVDPALGPRLRAALAAGGLDLVFQPIVSLHGEEQAQFQVLLRLAGDDGRLHTAAEIIPAAEREGLMTAVDQCVLDRCLAIAADRYRQEQPLRLFVSQSLASTCDPAHLAWLEARLAGDAHPRGWLSIDLRLADFDAEPAAVRAFAIAARDLGVLVTVTGCDGPAAAHAIAAGPAVDFVKLGPGPAGGRTDAQWSELKETVALVHDGGARVIAPRIEDARGAAALWGAGVDYIQGNFVQQATGDLGYDFHASAP